MRALVSCSFRCVLRALVGVASVGFAACAPHSFDGRPFDLTVPADASGPVPLVVLLHGYGFNGPAQDVYWDFSSRVDLDGFALAVPSGSLNQFGKRYWNGTDYCCDFDVSGVDDLAFLRGLVDTVVDEVEIDRGSVTFAGWSNGGFMALRAACDLSDVVTTAISQAGAAWLDFDACPAVDPAAGRFPVNVLQIHGTDDGVIAYDGERDAYPSAIGTVARFAARNGCSDRATLEEEPLDLTSDAGDETSRLAAPGCPDGGDASLWTIEGATHTPGVEPSFAEAALSWAWSRSSR